MLTKEEIDKYKLAVFKALRDYGIGQEGLWINIANKANIPAPYQDDIKNLLLHEDYITKTMSSDAGDLIRGNPSIIAAIYNLEERFNLQITNNSISNSTITNSNVNQQSDSASLDNPITQSVITTPSKKANISGKRWYSKPLFVYFIWPVLTGILVWLLVKLF